MKLLLIEDETELASSIKKYLETDGLLCEVAIDYLKAIEKINIYNYDCIIVDITLPHGNGLDIIKELKQLKKQSGIIIISAKNSIDDKIEGLELGSDDYLTKPFHLSELNARVKAIIRRKQFDANNELDLNELKIDLNAQQVTVNDIEIMLTQKEYELLLYFIANKNKVVTKSAIAEHLWGDDADQSDNYDFIYTHIKNLRKKMIEKGGSDYITTVYGMGYNFKTK